MISCLGESLHPHQHTPTMRCISSEGVDFSQLAQHSASQPHHHHHHHHPDPDDATTTTADVTSPAPRAPGKAGIDLKPLSLSDNSSSSSSPQLSPMSTTSDCDLLPHSDSSVFKDPPRMSSLPPRFITPQQFSSTSSPDLITLQESASKRSSSGISSTSSLYVNGDSESDSSRASTAKNTISGSSSLSTLPDDLSATEIRCASETHLLQKASTNTGGRKLFERRFRTDEILSDLSAKRPELSVLQMLKKDASDSETVPSVQLPERYRHALRKTGSYGNVVSGSRKGSGSGEQGGQDLTSREKDLGTALAWIRHEMVQMKEQDKVLLKRFIELRANILHLRCMYGSASDICSMDGSTVSLNEMRKPARLRNADSDATLSGRLYSASSSLSLPCSPLLSRLRFRSDDFM